MQLQTAIEKFVRGYKASTARAYEGVLQQLAAALGPARPLERIRRFDLTEYINDVRSDERGLAPSTQEKHVKTIKTFFRWLEEQELLDRDLGKHLKQKRLPRRIDRAKAMSNAELDKILAYTRYHPRRHAIVMFLADTGCRAGGAASLQIGPKLAPGQEPKEPGLYLEKRMAILVEKGDRERPVAFGEATAKALAEWLLLRPKTDNNYVFTSPDGKPITSAAISQIIRRICKRVGIRSLGAHSLRHRKGHNFADKGVPVTVAAGVLGHQDVMITAEYYYPHDWARMKQALESDFIQSEDDETDNDNILKLGGHS